MSNAIARLAAVKVQPVEVSVPIGDEIFVLRGLPDTTAFKIQSKSKDEKEKRAYFWNRNMAEGYGIPDTTLDWEDCDIVLLVQAYLVNPDDPNVGDGSGSGKGVGRYNEIEVSYLAVAHGNDFLRLYIAAFGIAHGRKVEVTPAGVMIDGTLVSTKEEAKKLNASDANAGLDSATLGGLGNSPEQAETTPPASEPASPSPESTPAP